MVRQQNVKGMCGLAGVECVFEDRKTENRYSRAFTGTVLHRLTAAVTEAVVDECVTKVSADGGDRHSTPQRTCPVSVMRLRSSFERRDYLEIRHRYVGRLIVYHLACADATAASNYGVLMPVGCRMCGN